MSKDEGIYPNILLISPSFLFLAESEEFLAARQQLEGRELPLWARQNPPAICNIFILLLAPPPQTKLNL